MMAAPSQEGRRSVALLLTGIIVVAALGYVVGIDDTRLERYSPSSASLWRDASPAGEAVTSASSLAIPATGYSNMRRMENGPTSRWEPSLQVLPTDVDYERCTTCHDPHAAIVSPSFDDKLRSLEVRAERRAFNGAPPVIPHAIRQTDDTACFACHGHGARIGERVANQMSHGLLVNCLQCHVARSPRALRSFEVDVPNSFAGLAAPSSGERAFPGAPPVIPHSTWMRENCLSCHGGSAGWPGLEVTHRWRANCRQCHAISSPLDAAPAASLSQFVAATATQP